MKTKIGLLVLLLSVSLVPASHALPLIPEVRPRLGVGFEPDEFVVGAQAFMRGRLFGLVRLAPSVDAGFGDFGSTVLLNLDLLSMTLAVNESIGLYGGGGIAMAFYNPEEGDGDSEFGINVVGGADIGSRFYGELRLGIDEMPDLRLLAGIRFVQK